MLNSKNETDILNQFISQFDSEPMRLISSLEEIMKILQKSLSNFEFIKQVKEEFILEYIVLNQVENLPKLVKIFQKKLSELKIKKAFVTENSKIRNQCIIEGFSKEQNNSCLRLKLIYLIIYSEEEKTLDFISFEKNILLNQNEINFILQSNNDLFNFIRDGINEEDKDIIQYLNIKEVLERINSIQDLMKLINNSLKFIENLEELKFNKIIIEQGDFDRIKQQIVSKSLIKNYLYTNNCKLLTYLFEKELKFEIKSNQIVLN